MSSEITMATVDDFGPSWKRVIVRNVNKWVKLLKERSEVGVLVLVTREMHSALPRPALGV